MITTLAGLLQAIADHEAQALGRQKIKHGPTIGDMYEGLTRTLLETAIPQLYVGEGFAIGADGAESRQLDCIVALGPGEPIPYASARRYPADQIVAVIEVKKTLDGSVIVDGYDNLASVVELQPKGGRAPAFARRAFQVVTGTAFPDSWAGADPRLDALRHALVIEAVTPVRILLGYHGYKTEDGLRRGVIDYFTNRAGQRGTGPRSVPQAIISRHAAVLKGNAMPWGGPHPEPGWWYFLFSTAQLTPARIVLELIWTRLNNLRLVNAAIFGDDRDVEPFHKLIDACFDPAGQGWVYHSYPPSLRRIAGTGPMGPVAWEPVRLSTAQNVIITVLCEQDELDLDRLPDGWPPEEQVLGDLNYLRAHGLAGPDAANPRVFRLLTERCQVVCDPELGWVAGEDSTGRLTRWLVDRIKRVRGAAKAGGESGT